MELKPGMSALVTGGASGIGKALALALAQNGIFVTVVDYSEERGKEVASLVEKENTKFHPKLKFPSAMFIRCDVTNTRDVSAAFQKHLEIYGGLDICINSAGVGTDMRFDNDLSDGSATWRRTININLTAVIDCTRLGIQAMRALKKPGVIVNLGSASGLYPMYVDPIYSGTKGGVILFTRSLAPLSREGIRVNVLCPEFVETELAAKVNKKHIDFLGGYMPMEMVVRGSLDLPLKRKIQAAELLFETKKRLLSASCEINSSLMRRSYDELVAGDLVSMVVAHPSFASSASEHGNLRTYGRRRRRTSEVDQTFSDFPAT